MQTFGGKELYPTAEEKAVHLLYFMVKNHPFIDGNGRTGRLLINKVLQDLGEEPIIIMFDDRNKYYDSIQNFRNTYWTGKQFILDN